MILDSIYGIKGENQPETYHQPIYHHGCRFARYLETILTGRKNLNDLWCFQRVSQKQKYGQPVPISCKIFTFRGWTNLNLWKFSFNQLHHIKIEDIKSWMKKWKSKSWKIVFSNLIEHLRWFSLNAPPIFNDGSALLHDMLRWIQKSKSFPPG